MPKFIIEVRDRATIDIIATTEIEADTYEAAIEKLEQEDYDLEFEPDVGLGWWDRHGDAEYKDITEQE
jgi:hypothetical protein